MQKRWQKTKRISIYTGEGALCDSLANVIYFEAAGNYTSIHLSGQKDVSITCHTLKWVEGCIHSEDFFRINKTYLVNLDYISRYYYSVKHLTVLLKNGEELPVSFRKRAPFLRVYNAL